MGMRLPRLPGPAAGPPGGGGGSCSRECAAMLWHTLPRAGPRSPRSARPRIPRPDITYQPFHTPAHGSADGHMASELINPNPIVHQRREHQRKVRLTAQVSDGRVARAERLPGRRASAPGADRRACNQRACCEPPPPLPRPGCRRRSALQQPQQPAHPHPATKTRMLASPSTPWRCMSMCGTSSTPSTPTRWSSCAWWSRS
jgi:hypothetical protein